MDEYMIFVPEGYIFQIQIGTRVYFKKIKSQQENGTQEIKISEENQNANQT